MNFDTFSTFCNGLEEVSEEFPFGPDTLVYKVRGKIFAITGIQEFNTISLKCDPELAMELRERYAEVTPGYHLNKQHWNSVRLDGSIPDKLLREWIQHSYDLVKSKSPSKKNLSAADKNSPTKITSIKPAKQPRVATKPAKKTSIAPEKETRPKTGSLTKISSKKKAAKKKK